MAEPEKLKESSIAPVDQLPKTTAAPVEAAPSVPGRAGRFFRRLFKWLMILAILAALGYGAWVGWPVARDRFIAPVEANTADMSVVQADLANARDRIATLEGEIANFASTQAELAAADAALTETLDAFAVEVDASSNRIADLEAVTADLGKGLEAAQSETFRQSQVLKAMELLGRARLFLYQSNFGLARLDVQSARNILADSLVGSEAADIELLTATINRLDRTLAALPSFPVLAADELDIAWQALIGDIPLPIEPAPTEEAPAATP